MELMIVVTGLDVEEYLIIKKQVYRREENINKPPLVIEVSRSRMKNIKDYIESGIIEAYVLGMATTEEVKEVEEMSVANEEIRAAINDFSDNLEKQALANAIAPDPTVKPFLMAVINYTQRLENGEPPSFPPMLDENSSLKDFEPWLSRPDMILPENFQEDVYAKIIGFTPEATTAIIWLKTMAPQEVHHDEYEKFLIVEGTCNITIGEDVHQLSAGDYLAIPLFKNHKVKVTSSTPCKAILQRIAA